MREGTSNSSVQDLYPADVAQCYGCGRLNEHGLHVRTFWKEGVGKATFEPEPWQVAVPGFVYGGLIASLIDCHAVGTAAAAALEAAGGELREGSVPRFVTASLHVDFRRPTPMGVELELSARAVEIGARKVTVDVELTAAGAMCVTARVVAVRLPEGMLGAGGSNGTSPSGGASRDHDG